MLGQTTDKYHKEDDKERGIVGIEEKISGYKVPFFERPQGSFLKSQIEKGLVEKISLWKFSIERFF